MQGLLVKLQHGLAIPDEVRNAWTTSKSRRVNLQID
jgi:hypothetical protein